MLRTFPTKTQFDSLIPASKISNLSQGMFVGAVSDNFSEEIDQKIFHAKIMVDNEKVKRETAKYVPIPVISDFTDPAGVDRMKEIIDDNYYRIKREVAEIIDRERKKIMADPELRKLLIPVSGEARRRSEIRDRNCLRLTGVGAM